MNNSQSLPLISVVLATCNGEQFIREQLNSVIQQTYSNLEIIVVDDKSTDNTTSIIEEYQQLSSNIQLHINETNIGYIKNFEKGCRLAKGEFIALCDQDDRWELTKISQLYEAIGNYALVYADSVLCNETMQPIGSNISTRVNSTHFNNPIQQAVFCRIYGHAMLIRSSFLQKSFPFLPIIPHDWWIAYTATIHGGIGYLPQPLAYYRQHSNNVFGAVGGKRNKAAIKNSRRKEQAIARERVKAFYTYCPEHLIKEKAILKELVKTYSSFSLANNLGRMWLFFSYYNLLLASKKRSLIRKWLFCFKMFTKII
ncbi:MAG: glycosyltransferase family 2 protein [Sediminibacterium sp.]|nr:MAG: putative glycosyltransferase [Chitinophagaceae bacterium]MDP1843163.1 glycosyltransferase family 2 protein [Sediminibacterium sp.]TXT33343.1 MAG: putative glycosyltransferase epsH [Chitinophagaceae bacterium]